MTIIFMFLVFYPNTRVFSEIVKSLRANLFHPNPLMQGNRACLQVTSRFLLPVAIPQLAGTTRAWTAAYSALTQSVRLAAN